MNLLKNRLRAFMNGSSNKGVTRVARVFNSWGQSQIPSQILRIMTPSENIFTRKRRPQLSVVVVFAALLMTIMFSGGVASADTAPVNSRDIEGVFGTAVEIRPPTAIVVASNSGLITLNFDSDSELKIGSSTGLVADVLEGDRVISTAARNVDDELVALKTIIRVANSQPITKHVVGVVTNATDEELSIQTRNGDVVNVLIPAGIDALAVGDGITMVARLDRSSGVLTAVGFELARATVERIQKARDHAADQAELARLSQIATDARSKHLSALDDASRALKRVIDSGRVDKATLDKATEQFNEIQRRFNELRGIYESAAQDRNEAQPLLKISGVLVDEIGSSTFTIVPKGEQDADPFSVEFAFDPDSTEVELPRDLLVEISRTAKNPQLLIDVRELIVPGSELDVRYSVDDDVRGAVLIRVRLPRLVEELETVLEHESKRAFHGVITLVEIDDSLEDALGIVIAANEKQGVKVAAKVTDETEVTLDGESSDISSLTAGQAVDIQFESSEIDSIPDITGSDVTLRALAIRARSSVPTREDHISGIVEIVDFDAPAITIRPKDGSLIRLTVEDDVPIIRGGKRVDFEAIEVGDLVIDAVRVNVTSSSLTRLVVVAQSNVKFRGTVTGIGREPNRLLVTGENGQSLNVLVTGETVIIIDGRRIAFSAVKTGMKIINGVYTVTGRGGAFYNVATIISIESPKVVRATGIITFVNAADGELTVLSGKSTNTHQIKLKLPAVPLGENLLKDGLPIESLSEVRRGDRVDIVFYVLESGVVEKLSVVSDNFIQARGTLIGVSSNNRVATVELANGRVFDLWVGTGSNMRLHGRRIATLRPVAELLNQAENTGADISALVPGVLFIKDSTDSDRGVIITIQFQIKVESELTDDANAVELTVSGPIEAINGDTWVVDGRVFTVVDETQLRGDNPEVGLVAVAVLVSGPDGAFVARTISISGRPR
jgi:hypothetical protein